MAVIALADGLMSSKPTNSRVTIRRMLAAVVLISAGFGLTRGAFALVNAYQLTAAEHVVVFLLLAGAGVNFGLAIACFVGWAKSCTIIGALSWPTLTLIFTAMFCEMFGLDCAQWTSSRAKQTRTLVFYLASDGKFMSNAGRTMPAEGIDNFLQQLEQNGIIDATQANSHGVNDGRDYWGRKLILEVSGSILRVRSRGRDGIDQNGGGDDIQALVDYKDPSAIVRITP